MSRRPDDLRAEKFNMTYDHGAIAATATVKLYKVPAGRTLRLDRTSYNNPTGLVGDNTNAISLSINNGATVASLVFNTDTDDVPAGATLPVNTFVEGSLVAAAVVFQAGDIVSAVFTKDGTGALALGHLVLEGRLF